MISTRMCIPHSASAVGDAEAHLVAGVIEQNFVGPGPRAAELEAWFRSRTGRRHAFAVVSGFHASLLGLLALDLPPASVIALPVLTCPSLLAAIEWTGHRPGLVDISPRDLTIDIRELPLQVAAVIAPHAYGAPVNVRSLAATGRPWIEDCATSPATVVNGRPAGAWGTLAVFSLNSTKYMTGGLGGIVLTNDDLLANRVHDLLEIDRGTRPQIWMHRRPPPFPGRLPDLNAALALAQTGRLDELAARRREIAKAYDAHLGKTACWSLPAPSAGHCYYRYLLRTQGPSAPMAKALQRRGVDARVSVNPWLDKLVDTTDRLLSSPFAGAAVWRDHLLSLPIHPNLRDEDVRYVIESLLEVAEDGAD